MPLTRMLHPDEYAVFKEDGLAMGKQLYKKGFATATTVTHKIAPPHHVHHDEYTAEVSALHLYGI